MLIEAEKIEKYYAERLIFAIESIKVYRGDKIGIVGQNGAGKSTLLKILTGRLEPDKGTVRIRGAVAYVDQLDEKPDGADAQTGIFAAKADAKSGGEIMRKKLAAAFSAPFDVLALDEPTSNLDADGIETLHAALANVETLLLISHDRRLLDAHCTKIIELKDGRASVFSGGWSDYKETADALRSRQEFLYAAYARDKKRLEQAARQTSERAAKMKKTPARMGNSEARLHKRESTAKQAKVAGAGKVILSRLERLEAVERPREIRSIKPDFSLTNPPQNKIVLSCGNLNFAYGDRVVFAQARLEIQNGAHVAITGANGSGKSTLLDLIAARPDLIYRVPKAKLGYMSQNFADLDAQASVIQNVSDTAVQPQSVCRGVLAHMGFRGDDVYKKAGTLSGGERIKVSLSRLIVSDCNVLLLDEPTNYLDIDSIVQIQDAITRYDGTVLFVSHDCSFVTAAADIVLQIRDKKILPQV